MLYCYNDRAQRFGRRSFCINVIHYIVLISPGSSIVSQSGLIHKFVKTRDTDSKRYFQCNFYTNFISQWTHFLGFLYSLQSVKNTQVTYERK